MLKSAVGGLGDREINNILAGFKACGLVPFNPDAVLAKIARKEPTTPGRKQQGRNFNDNIACKLFTPAQDWAKWWPEERKKIEYSIGTKYLQEENPNKPKRASDNEDEDDLQTLEAEGQNVNDDYEIGGESSAEPEDIPDSSGGCDTGDFIIINTKLIREIDFILLKLLKCQTLN